MMLHSKLWPLSIGAALVVALSVSVVSAAPWSGPTQAPPAGNTPTPINVGSDSQYKAGGFQASVIASDNIIMGTQYCFQGPLNCITSWTGAGPWTLAGADIYYSGGKVGIGTSTPGSNLAVQGVANFATATSTFYSTGGINIKSGCFAVNGVCVSQQQQRSGVLCVIIYSSPAYIYCVRISDGVVLSLKDRGPWIKISNGEGWPGGSSWECEGGVALFCTRVTDGVVATFNGSEWSYFNMAGWIF